MGMVEIILTVNSVIGFAWLVSLLLFVFGAIHLVMFLGVNDFCQQHRSVVSKMDAQTDNIVSKTLACSGNTTLLELAGINILQTPVQVTTQWQATYEQILATWNMTEHNQKLLQTVSQLQSNIAQIKTALGGDSKAPASLLQLEQDLNRVRANISAVQQWSEQTVPGQAQLFLQFVKTAISQIQSDLNLVFGCASFGSFYKSMQVSVCQKLSVYAILLCVSLFLMASILTCSVWALCVGTFAKAD